MRNLILVCVALAVVGCSSLPLDGGRSGFDVRSGWEASDGSAKIPDAFAGVNVLVGSESRLSPAVGLELASFALPKVGETSVQVQAGVDLLDIYVGKKVSSKADLSFGPFFGRDLAENESTWGLGGVLVKF